MKKKHLDIFPSRPFLSGTSSKDRFASRHLAARITFILVAEIDYFNLTYFAKNMILEKHTNLKQIIFYCFKLPKTSE